MKCCQSPIISTENILQTQKEQLEQLNEANKINIDLFREISIIQRQNSSFKKNMTQTLAFLKNTESTNMKTELQNFIDFQKQRNLILQLQLKNIKKVDLKTDARKYAQDIKIGPLVIPKKVSRLILSKNYLNLNRIQQLLSQIANTKEQKQNVIKYEIKQETEQEISQQLTTAQEKFLKIGEKFSQIDFKQHQRISELKSYQIQLKHEKEIITDDIQNIIEEVEKEEEFQNQICQIESVYGKILILLSQEVENQQKYENLHKTLEKYNKIDEIKQENTFLINEIPEQSMLHTKRSRLLFSQFMELEIFKFNSEIKQFRETIANFQNQLSTPSLVESEIGLLENESELLSEYYREEIDKIGQQSKFFGFKGQLLVKYKNDIIE